MPAAARLLVLSALHTVALITVAAEPACRPSSRFDSCEERRWPSDAKCASFKGSSAYYRASACRYAAHFDPLSAKEQVDRRASRDCTKWASRLRRISTPKAFKACRAFSQVCQDGILRTIFDRISTTNKYFVEFGFGYSGSAAVISDRNLDTTMLNTRLLAYEGWKGTYFDDKYEMHSKAFNITKRLLSETNIVSSFEQAGVPKDADYVSIDIDSIDAWLMNALLAGGYRPRVIGIEYNANFPPDTYITMNRTWRAWRGSAAVGTGAGALNYIATKHGYKLVHMASYLDMFFVDEKVLQSWCDLRTLPSYDDLSRGMLPSRAHKSMSPEDVRWLTDYRIALSGDETAARAVASAQVQEANTRIIKQAKRMGCFSNSSSAKVRPCSGGGRMVTPLIKSGI